MTQQEYENKIKELQDELEELKAAKIEAEQPKRWKPSQNQAYFTVEIDGQVECVSGYPDEVIEWDFLIGNCLKTKEEAEERKKQIEYTARYKNYIEEHSEPLVWKNYDQCKLFVGFDYVTEKIEVGYTSFAKNQGVIYASSEQIIRDAIEEIGKDNFNKYVLGVK